MATNISMDQRKQFANRVGRKFDKFWQWKMPIPVDPVADIYRCSYTDKEWTALRYLMQEKPKAINKNSSFELYLTEDTSGGYNCPHVIMRFPKGIQMPYIGIKLSNLPQEIQNRLRSWITGVNHFLILRKQLMERVNGVMGNPANRRQADLDPCVNTPRQLLRLWPELQPMFYSDWKADCRQLSIKSRLPSHVGYHGTEGDNMYFATPEQFRCEHAGATDYEKQSFQQINDILTMLSLADDVPNVDDYPTFYGRF